jgi:D-lyxose ketol-isomerase
MKRSQINYAIDKAHAIAETFRMCLPEFAFLPPMPGENSR